jgi:hypothetical protein
MWQCGVQEGVQEAAAHSSVSLRFLTFKTFCDIHIILKCMFVNKRVQEGTFPYDAEFLCWFPSFKNYVLQDK